MSRQKSPTPEEAAEKFNIALKGLDQISDQQRYELTDVKADIKHNTTCGVCGDYVRFLDNLPAAMLYNMIETLTALPYAREDGWVFLSAGVFEEHTGFTKMTFWRAQKVLLDFDIIEKKVMFRQYQSGEKSKEWVTHFRIKNNLRLMFECYKLGLKAVENPVENSKK